MPWNIKNDLRCNRLALRYNTHIFDGNGFPTSGTTGTGVNTRTGIGADPGSIYIDYNTGTQFRNAGTAASPYWYPVNFDDRNIEGVGTDFRRFTTKAGSDTATIYQDKGTGVRIFGLGLGENDANTAQTLSHPAGGPLLTSGCDNQADYNVALGYGSTTALWTPAANGPLVVEANFTAITDILTRTFFLGFSGESIDALVTLVKGATVTMTFSPGGTTGDDVHGLFMGSALTAASSVFCPSVKGNAAASVTTTVAALDTASTVAAAATYNRWRLEIAADGAIRGFINKVQVIKKAAASAGLTTALCPVFQMANTTTTASLSMGVREFYAYAKRSV